MVVAGAMYLGPVRAGVPEVVGHFPSAMVQKYHINILVISPMLKWLHKPGQLP